jgi:hypothetical protein
MQLLVLKSLVDAVGITHLTRLMPNYPVPRALHIKSNTLSIDMQI